MKKFSGSAISRHQVFSLADGTFVVQWDDKRVQDLLSGRYRDYDHRRDYGHAVTDYELKQLKAAGRVEHFNKNFVWMYALPESGRYGMLKVMGRGERIHAFYLSTALPKSQLQNVQATLRTMGVDEDFQARSRSSIVVILGKNGKPFGDVEEAEGAQSQLMERAPEIFSDLTVAFIELDVRAMQRAFGPQPEDDLNLDELIASQGDTSVTAGRQVVLALPHAEERSAVMNLFKEMKLDVKESSTGYEALELVEDYHPDLLVMDLMLPDMHGYQMISKLKEIETLREMPIMLITNEVNLSMTVARVEYLTRPVSIARMRHNVWKVLHEHIMNPRLPSN